MTAREDKHATIVYDIRMLVSRIRNSLTKSRGAAPGSRKRDDRAYREYVREEQRVL
jgi:hypothetical protein